MYVTFGPHQVLIDDMLYNFTIEYYEGSATYIINIYCIYNYL